MRLDHGDGGLNGSSCGPPRVQEGNDRPGNAPGVFPSEPGSPVSPADLDEEPRFPVVGQQPDGLEVHESELGDVFRADRGAGGRLTEMDFGDRVPVCPDQVGQAQAVNNDPRDRRGKRGKDGEHGEPAPHTCHRRNDREPPPLIQFR